MWLTAGFSCFLSDENEAEMAEKGDDDEGDDGSSDGGVDDEEDGVITEIRFVPSDKASRE